MRVFLLFSVACLGLVSALRLEHLVKNRAAPVNSGTPGPIQIPAGTSYYKVTLDGAATISGEASQSLLDNGKSVDQASNLNLGLPTQPPPPTYEPVISIPSGTAYKLSAIQSAGGVLDQSEQALDNLVLENYQAKVEVGIDDSIASDGHQEAIDVNVESRLRKYAEDPSIPAFTIPAGTSYFQQILKGAAQINDEAGASIEANKLGVWTAAVENERAMNTDIPTALMEKVQNANVLIPDGTAFLKNVIDEASSVATETNSWMQGTEGDLRDATAINEAVAKDIF